MRRDSATHAYIGTCPCCGSVPSVAVDVPEDPKGTAKYVAEMVRGGLTVTRVALAQMRDIPIRRCVKVQAAQDAKAARKAAKQAVLL